MIGGHKTERDSDGRVHCECGVVSQRFGTVTNAHAWAVNHRREAKIAAKAAEAKR